MGIPKMFFLSHCSADIDSLGSWFCETLGLSSLLSTSAAGKRQKTKYVQFHPLQTVRRNSAFPWAILIFMSQSAATTLAECGMVYLGEPTNGGIVNMVRHLQKDGVQGFKFCHLRA